MRGARRARQPPGRMLAINPARHPDVGHGTDAAHGVERQQALKDRQALQPAVAIGQQIVEKEIPGHGDVGGAGLRQVEAHLRQAQRALERQEMRPQAADANQHEQQKPRRQQVAGDLGQQEAGVFEHHQAVEFRLPVSARAKAIGHLLDQEGSLLGGNDIEQQLEAASTGAGRRPRRFPGGSKKIRSWDR